MDEVLEIINSVIIIFTYVVPGIVFLKVFSYICNKKLQSESYLVVTGILISFLLVSLVKIYIPNNSNLLAVWSNIAAVISAFIISMFCKSKYFPRALLVLKINRTIHDSMWDEIMDEHDVFIKVYIPSDQVMYYGMYKGHEPKDDSTYILITDYEIRDYDNKVIKDNSKDRTRWAIINTKDISRVDLIYSDKSIRSKKNTKKLQVEGGGSDGNKS